MLQSKQSDQFDTLRLTHVVAVVSAVVTCSSCSLPLSIKSGKRLKMRRKLMMTCKKAKVNVNMVCFSLIKGQ